MRNRFQAIVAALAVALFAAPAAAQESEYETQVRTYLENGMSVHTALGYRRERNTPDMLQPLRSDAPYLWTINLRAGQNYRIYGACDNDCSDLDMEIYGADGQLVDRDVAVDDVPYVQITPTRSGAHHVRVWVFACSAEPCYSGARVMVGGTPQERVVEAVEPEETEATGPSYEEVVRAELDAGGATLEPAGYARFGEDAIQAITVDSTGYSFTVPMERRRYYAFQGACDQDCTDVDMEITDSRGRRVAVDEADNDRPTVSFRPGRAGDYTVRIWLAACSVEPCYVGVRSFQR